MRISITVNFLSIFFVLASSITLKSSGAHDHDGEKYQLGRRSLLGGLQSLLGPGSNSLLASPDGILGSAPSSNFNPSSLPQGPPPQHTYGDAPWTQAEAAYRSLIVCPSGLGGQRGVVLLVPPTGGNGRQAWLKSPYVELLPKYGFSTCWVDNPTRSAGDIQLTAEFIAYAIKFLASQTRAPVSIITYSQGGIDAQWAIVFWPSARRLVRNMITLASPFHGTVDANVLCPVSELIGGCLPAVFQMASNSRFIRALTAPVYGSGATALVPTTSIYTLQDEVVPQVGSRPTSSLPGASNIALQQICGMGHVADHFLIVGDLAAYGIALNALLSGGVANPATISRSICSQSSSVGYQVGSLANDLRYALGTVVGNPRDRIGNLLTTVTTLRVPAEPPLQLYVCQRGFATGCTGNGFLSSQGSAPILSSLPQAIRGIGPALGGLLGGGSGGGLL